MNFIASVADLMFKRLLELFSREGLSKYTFSERIIRGRVHSIVFSCMIICCTHSVYSQSNKIDSLTTVIDKSHGLGKYDPLINLARVYWATADYTTTHQIVERANQIASEAGDSAKIVTSSRILGQVFNRLNKPKEAELILLKALPVARRHNFGSDIKMILRNLGVTYSYLGQYDIALDLNFQALALQEEDNDDEGMGISLNNIGLVYYKLKDFRKALIYYERSAEFAKKAGDNYSLTVTLLNIGQCYAYLEEYGQAQLYVEKGLKSCDGDNCPDERKIEADFAMGVVYFGLKQSVEAESSFLKSYLLSEKTGRTRFQFDNIDYLSQIYIQQNQFDKAKYYLTSAERLINKGEPFNLELIKIYSRFFQMYNKLKNFEKASFYQQKYIQLKDSIYNEGLTTSLMKIEADHLERENRAKIAAQEQVLMLREEIINNQRILNIVTGALVFFLVAFAIVLWRNYLNKKKANVILDEKIRVRTRVLELNQDELLRTIKQRDLLIANASNDIKDTLSAMQGLCSLGLKDVSDPTALQYLSQMEKASSNLSSNLKGLLYVKESVVVS